MKPQTAGALLFAVMLAFPPAPVAASEPPSAPSSSEALDRAQVLLAEDPFHAVQEARLAAAGRALAALAAPSAPRGALPLGEDLDRLLAEHGARSDGRTFLAKAQRAPVLAAALAATITAFLAFEQAAPRTASAAPVAAVRQLLLSHDLKAGLAALPPAAAAADPGLEEARLQLLAALGNLARATAGTPPQLRAGLVLDAPPAVGFDLEGKSSVWTDDVALLVDAGGDDTYLNNAGGAGGAAGTSLQCPTVPAGAAALLDMAGDDSYLGQRSCGSNGGGYVGAGLLVDLAGDDVYEAGAYGVNGGGFEGSGLLLDLGAGDDRYSSGVSYLGLDAGVAAQGGAAYGEGLLLDDGGKDTYTAGVLAVNGGAVGGSGALLDLGSDVDNYEAAAALDFGVGALGSAGANGGGLLGSGLLLDAGGDDGYASGSIASDGGGFLGSGALLDLAGSDTYVGGSYGSVGGAVAGAGLLLDLAGDDTYAAEAPGSLGEALTLTGCSLGPCFVEHPYPAGALLLDAGGRDRYAEGAATEDDASYVVDGLGGARLDLPPALPLRARGEGFAPGAGVPEGVVGTGECVAQDACVWFGLVEVGDRQLRLDPYVCAVLQERRKCADPLGSDTYVPLPELLGARLAVGAFDASASPGGASLNGSVALSLATPVGSQRIDVPLKI